MSSLAVLDMAGKKVSDIELNDSVFGIEPNMSAMHLLVVSYLANKRQGTQSTRTRSEVSGGGKKPWRQKGTGRARQGSTRAPQWYHGGIALGPKPRTYGIDVNKKVRRLAMKSAFSSKVAAGEMTVVDSIKLDAIKTADMVKMLSAVGAKKKVLVVLPEKDEVIYKSVRNIEGAKVSLVNTLNVYDILNCDSFIVAKDAVAKIEEVYA
ncbi:MAG: 50S ribosomal protein L4 [Oscillospiraceae bacterium]|nr:50S ribosomal protein L4 [Oscillospiraceae bacterium]MDD7470685.1 50S ribosomal protein L4 [Oscillospiraceae bacterium]MDO4397486.1 50S ribosomal protein L4 [Oscillospiraceae bacterium]MDY2678995.1 50S ribosomal protein L4 [Oscillospiraceae bacterium]